MAEVLVIEPVFAERLWGGSALRRMFGSSVPAGVIGECWAISAMPGMSGAVRGTPGWTLRDAWAAGQVSGRPEEGDFPLLCKFLDPQDWLSVQVHPDDDQARALEGQPRGKAECWLVVSCDEDCELILGHRAGSADELRVALAEGRLLDDLIRIRVAADDFFMVAPGELHTLGPGLLVYEVQQSSDLTYRLYDFDRVGPDGQTRPLHVDRGFAVVRAPHDPGAVRTAGPWLDLGHSSRTRVLVDCPQFRVQRWETLHGRFTIPVDGYQLLTCIGGGGRLAAAGQSVELGLGTSLVLPTGTGPVEVAGDLILVASAPGDASG